VSERDLLTLVAGVVADRDGVRRGWERRGWIWGLGSGANVRPEACTVGGAAAPGTWCGRRSHYRLGVTRELSQGEYVLGLAGLALLRIYGDRDAGAAEECLAEIHRLLERLGAGPLAEPIHGPVVRPEVGYADWSQVYDQAPNFLIDLEGPVVRDLLDSLGGEPVLDAGCGTGRHLEHLAARGRRTIGVDPSSEMLARAATKVAGGDLRRGDLTRLPVADGEAANVVCCLVLEHVEDLSAAFAELARVIVPGGSLIVSTLHPVMAQVVGWSAWFVDLSGQRYDVASFSHGVSDYLKAALAAGFSLERCLEPRITSDDANRIREHAAPIASMIAYQGLPVTLVLHLKLE
jgi:SAM-dependent methyltransferase